MDKNRSRALRINVICGWASELFALISGLILPRLVLVAFGSSANGLVNSISQFLGFSVVLRAGVGAVTRAALFKPLAENDIDSVSAIMVATRSYMRKVSLIIAGYIGLISVSYPFIANGEHSKLMMFVLVLIVGATTFVENFFGIKAMILLQADQKYYIHTIFALISMIAAFAVSVLLIQLGFSLIVVKLGAMCCTFISPILLNLYVRRHYKLNMSTKANNVVISQRWDAFAQQMAIVVNSNIPLVILTFFVDLKEVSVYTIHNMVVLNIKKVVETCVVGTNSAFGSMMANGEEKELERSFKFIEWIYYAASTVVFSVTAIMFVPFIRIYTNSITDVNYIRPTFAFTMSFVALVACMRVLCQNLVEAAGHFKQTRNGSIVEVIINICSSLIFVYFFGVIGVLFGMLVSSIIRTIQYALYATKNVLKISRWHVVRSMGVYVATFLAIVLLGSLIKIPTDLNYLTWCAWALISVVFAFVVVLIVSLVNNKTQVGELYTRFIKRKR